MRLTLALLHRLALSVLAPCLLCAMAGCHGDAGTPLRSVELSACHVKGIDTELRCGELSVAENRDDHSLAARHIKVWFALMPALARTGQADPIFVIAGGPGQSASSVAGQIMPLFQKLNRNRDIVFVDQRGTGHSAALNCAPPKDVGTLATQLDPQVMVQSVAACAHDDERQGIALDHYLTIDAVADLDEIRVALGYRQINLWGASYGTRVELDYLREHGEHVRSAVLDGVAPPDMKLPVSFAIDADAALDRVIAVCAAQPACVGHYPHLQDDLTQLFDTLRRQPQTIEIPDPISGERARVPMTRDTLASWVRQPLYSPLTASLVPAAILEASHGNYNILAAINLSFDAEVFDAVSLGMHLSVICSEDETRVTAADLAGLAQTRFGDSFYRLYHDLCAQWPTRPVDAAFYTPLKSDRPILLLAGGMDPATPPRHAREVLAGLSDARLLIAPNLGHGISMQACAPDLIDQFFRHPDPAKIDGRCLAEIPLPPFFQPLGSEPSR